MEQNRESRNRQTDRHTHTQSPLIYNKGTPVILGWDGDHGLFNKTVVSHIDIHMEENETRPLHFTPDTKINVKAKTSNF